MAQIFLWKNNYFENLPFSAQTFYDWAFTDFNWENDDVTDDNIRTTANSVTNLKRAIYRIVEQLLSNTYIEYASDKKDFLKLKFSAKLEALSCLNITHRNVGVSLVECRDRYEHQYTLPRASDLKSILQSADLFWTHSLQTYKNLNYPLGLVFKDDNAIQFDYDADLNTINNITINSNCNFDYYYINTDKNIKRVVDVRPTDTEKIKSHNFSDMEYAKILQAQNNYIRELTENTIALPRKELTKIFKELLRHHGIKGFFLTK
ncbi:hypothetical protein [Candidatus Venteria ishoeyi]|uniref:Uncharacterized protein n=1 Tax=Candidatus Venteria ishoeyi TaxID=1899563 RepID=A0A1H6FEV6_9GAMM|nr:hypothetical protein [Candidatus Venteria ishoeyi]SEH07565.1 Uncharacterised protein [Candidatus Venteria ishoeyi]